MYCPHCGKTTSTEQKFCRACGLKLDGVVQVLAAQLSSADIDKHLQNRQHLVERTLTVLVGGGGAVFVISIIWAIIERIIIGKGHLVGGALFIALLLSMMVALLLVLYRESLLEAVGKRKVKPSVTPQLGSVEKKQLNESSFEPMGSVTERTTDLLRVEWRKSSGEL